MCQPGCIRDNIIVEYESSRLATSDKKGELQIDGDSFQCRDKVIIIIIQRFPRIHFNSLTRL